jgi:hypothetical protein
MVHRSDHRLRFTDPENPTGLPPAPPLHDLCREDMDIRNYVASFSASWDPSREKALRGDSRRFLAIAGMM